LDLFWEMIPHRAKAQKKGRKLAGGVRGIKSGKREELGNNRLPGRVADTPPGNLPTPPVRGKVLWVVG